MMKDIYIIRHGETEYNKMHRMQGRGIDASLNKEGRSQAEAICNFMKDKAITKIVTSSLKRAIETANPLSEELKIKLETFKDLDEMNFGVLEGKPFKDVIEDLKYLQTQWSSGNLQIAPEAGENPIEVFDRAGSKIMNVIETSKDQQIIFMIHGRLIRILLSEFLGLGLKNMHEIEHQNGSINHLSWNGNQFEVVELNIITHLG